ncbi:EamA-like transporter family protein [Verrucomicrobium sp. GAS474]|uniref:DMT family transporter n=1 Tax=Verrucomicrobium sp. GAS474 TaxID=1882831 RepID=UPI00087BDEE5|nr:DMT family transporter [Verrucomicrobium sp. GAS474]SDU21966.1 EamA-like transporter family protein [Verrucomicrobium sp. GAS474]
MPSLPRTLLLTSLSLLAFAGNSLLSRLALKETGIDPGSFIVIRLATATLTLLALVLVRKRGDHPRLGGSWLSAFALLLYAVPFTFSYVLLSAGTGALLSFGAVQLTMLIAGWRRGEIFNGWQGLGLLLALGGILVLLLPGATAPPLFEALLMIVAGVGWGFYSLRGQGRGDPLAENAGNFLRATSLVVLATLGCLPFFHGLHWVSAGIVYAVCSGVVTSAFGYIIWYAALRGLSATSAATVQLSVPVLTALISLPLLGEAPTLRLVLVSLAVLAGIALTLLKREASPARP